MCPRPQRPGPVRVGGRSSVRPPPCMRGLGRRPDDRPHDDTLRTPPLASCPPAVPDAPAHQHAMQPGLTNSDHATRWHAAGGRKADGRHLPTLTGCSAGRAALRAPSRLTCCWILICTLSSVMATALVPRTSVDPPARVTVIHTRFVFLPCLWLELP